MSAARRTSPTPSGSVLPSSSERILPSSSARARSSAAAFASTVPRAAAGADAQPGRAVRAADTASSTSSGVATKNRPTGVAGPDGLRTSRVSAASRHRPPSRLRSTSPVRLGGLEALEVGLGRDRAESEPVALLEDPLEDPHGGGLVALGQVPVAHAVALRSQRPAIGALEVQELLRRHRALVHLHAAVVGGLVDVHVEGRLVQERLRLVLAAGAPKAHEQPVDGSHGHVVVDAELQRRAVLVRRLVELAPQVVGEAVVDTGAAHQRAIVDVIESLYDSGVYWSQWLWV